LTRKEFKIEFSHGELLSKTRAEINTGLHIAQSEELVHFGDVFFFSRLVRTIVPLVNLQSNFMFNKTSFVLNLLVKDLYPLVKFKPLLV